MIPVIRQCNRVATLAVLAGIMSLSAGVWAADQNIPRLRKQGTATQLVVDGKPLLILGCSVSETSTANPDAIKTIWPRLAHMNINTALTPVSWNVIEPMEGQFDFAVVDALIKGAQANKLHLVIQWFGSYTNATGASAPAWVKSGAEGANAQTIAPVGDEDASADAKAFAALMKHIGEVDASHVVVAVQVESKAGLLRTEDAKNVGNVAAAGKAAYAVPMYVDCPVDPKDAQAVNDWTISHLFEVWHAGAPAIDMIAPDTDAPNFAAECAKFARADNPLFIFEADGGPTGGADFLYAIGKFNAIGMAVADAPDSGTPDTAIPAVYTTIAGMAPGILENQGKDTLFAFAFGPGSPDESAQQEVAKIGQFTFTVRASAAAPVGGGRGAGGGFGGAGGGRQGGGRGGFASPIGTSTTLSGIIIPMKSNEFLVLHSGLSITVAPNDSSLGSLALGFQENGSFINGRWTRYQRTNGDENDHDRRVDGALNARWTNLRVAYYQRP